MPLYAYHCDRCDTKFEFWRGFDDPPVTVCPDCETPTLRKLFAPTPVHFKCVNITKTGDFTRSCSRPRPSTSRAMGGTIRRSTILMPLTGDRQNRLCVRNGSL